MSLRINTLVRKIPQILFIIIGLFLLGCLVKVIIWEHSYYAEKEGSMRKPTIEVGITAPDQDEVDESEITQDQIQEHQVAPDKPRFIRAAFMNRTMGIGIPARVMEVGLTSSGAMATRANIYDVAWFRNSGKPGQGGTMLMNGHNGGPNKDGVFKDLPSVTKGEIIEIERGDGELFQYEVYEIKILSIEEADKYMSTMLKSPIPGRESLSLISCTGEWSQQRHTYLSRIMIRAVLTERIEE